MIYFLLYILFFSFRWVCVIFLYINYFFGGEMFFFRSFFLRPLIENDNFDELYCIHTYTPALITSRQEEYIVVQDQNLLFRVDIHHWALWDLLVLHPTQSCAWPLLQHATLGQLGQGASDHCLVLLSRVHGIGIWAHRFCFIPPTSVGLCFALLSRGYLVWQKRGSKRLVVVVVVILPQLTCQGGL